MNFMNFILSESKDLIRDKQKLQEKNKYNKFHMENIQAKATLQLLNLQDDGYEHYDDSFRFLADQRKQNSKSKQLSIRTLSLFSSHRTIKPNTKENNKQILKSTLKKLLERQVQLQKPQWKRVKTSEHEQNSKNHQKIYQILNKNQNAESSRLFNLKQLSTLSLKKENRSLHKQKDKEKENLMHSNKQKSAFSIFEQQSEQIRKAIKRRMNEKSETKGKRTIFSNKILENVQKGSIFNQRSCNAGQINGATIYFKLLTEDTPIFKLSNLQTKRETNQKQLKRQSKPLSRNKENLKGFTKTFANIRREQTNHYQSRKLKNILF